MIRKMLAHLAALLSLAIASTAWAQAPVTLKVHHFLPPGSTTHAKLLVPWCERIEREAAGRLKCQLYPSMQLGGTAPQLFDQARDGIADIVWTLPGYTAGRFPVMEAFELPFLTGDAEAASKAAWEFYERHGKQEFREVRPLAVHVHDAGYLHTRDKQIRTLADFRGLKLRAPTRQTNRLLAALGATPVSMPVTGLADAMSKGVIDGAVIPWEVVPAVKVQEIARFHTETDPNMPAMYTAVFLLAMNRKTYDGLPADLRAVIDRNSGLDLSGHAGRPVGRAEGARPHAGARSWQHRARRSGRRTLPLAEGGAAGAGRLGARHQQARARWRRAAGRRARTDRAPFKGASHGASQRGFLRQVEESCAGCSTRSRRHSR
jgi:TRAP-type transport system periplasmic protein